MLLLFLDYVIFEGLSDLPSSELALALYEKELSLCFELFEISQIVSSLTADRLGERHP
jgi:hypothetical protein